jgi:hypothetical protein
MKNKSKLQKIKQRNQIKSAAVPSQWLYINEKEVDFDAVCEAFTEWENVTVQVWKEAGVAELEIADSKSIDLEWSEVELGDDYSDDFLVKHHAKTLFFVTIAPEEYDKAASVMQVMTKQLGGFFCGDTDDFTPIIKNERDTQ